MKKLIVNAIDTALFYIFGALFFGLALIMVLLAVNTVLVALV